MAILRVELILAAQIPLWRDCRFVAKNTEVFLLDFPAVGPETPSHLLCRGSLTLPLIPIYTAFQTNREKNGSAA